MPRLRTLAPEDLDHYARNGFIHVPGAFSRQAALAMQDFMWRQLEKHRGIVRGNPSTWSGSWSVFQETRNHPIYEAIASPRLLGAINDLHRGAEEITPDTWGQFIVSPPDRWNPDWNPKRQPGPWQIPKDCWHWDASPNHSDSTADAMKVFTFFSSVGHQGGGTLVVAGSHRLVVRFFDGLSPQDMQPKSNKKLQARFTERHPWLAMLTGKSPDPDDRTAHFMRETIDQDGVPLRVVEFTGEPGDAILSHGWNFHTVSHHNGDYPRFMRTGYAVR